jgi:sirohydrochlorin ferrochelatase
LAEGLKMAVRSRFRTIVVQPHLLFAGQVLDEIRRALAEVAAGEGAGKQWILTQHLGPSTMVAEAILELAGGASSGRMRPEHGD